VIGLKSLANSNKNANGTQLDAEVAARARALMKFQLDSGFLIIQTQRYSWLALAQKLN